MTQAVSPPPRLSSACRANHSSHPDVSMSALNLHIRSLLRWQESMALLGLATVDFEFKARGGQVRSACPARCPNTHPLACILTLLPLTFCAGLSTEKCGGPQGGLLPRPTSTSFDAQRPLGEFHPHLLKLLPARYPVRGSQKGHRSAT